jgi:hypothetical protein
LFTIAEVDDLAHARKLVEILTDTENQDIKDVKLSVSIYCKTFYKTVQSNGFQNAGDTNRTLAHIGCLFECMQSLGVELKPKFGIIPPLEQMLALYSY